MAVLQYDKRRFPGPRIPRRIVDIPRNVKNIDRLPLTLENDVNQSQSESGWFQNSFLCCLFPRFGEYSGIEETASMQNPCSRPDWSSQAAEVQGWFGPCTVYVSVRPHVSGRMVAIALRSPHGQDTDNILRDAIGLLPFKAHSMVNTCFTALVLKSADIQQHHG
ncbi:hypothetical protein CC80DRAFT_507734 [Byssothecium circinans]|uniref:Uncharacterized protein n=1 Tax=Byssothecium circinans TaxID=147558 RepID=A0A6A5TM17_9PLEO|nr:hypothetical protein CC80DRAFT_507734 [Byssothecium circinans]